VHIRAARLFAPDAVPLADEDASKIFLQLRRVLKRFVRNAPIPANESYRQAVLKQLNILDTPPEEQFDRLTKLASQHFKAPIALISLVDKDRQWFMSRCGLDVAQTERDIAFCAHAIMADEPLIVLDATKDPRFSNNPIVVGEPHVRFYAGAPLITAEGVKLGTFCVIDQRPRSEFSPAERTTLQNFAMRAMDMIYARVFHWLSTQEPERQVQSAREAGSLSSAATRHFLNTVSSEIREPLSAILSLSQIMGSEESRPNDLDEYKAYAQAITASAELLMRTLKSTMSGRQAQHGEFTLKIDTIDVAELIRNCALPYQIRARARQVDFAVAEIRGDLPSLSADRAQTEQMVVHLIANAMSVASHGGRVEVAAKTSPSKGIEIRVLARPAALTRPTPAEQAEPIGTARAASEDETRLAVAKQLIEMHGGRLECVSGVKGEVINTLTFPPFRALPVEASRERAWLPERLVE
jgi:signal transduction histidine kinase